VGVKAKDRFMGGTGMFIVFVSLIGAVVGGTYAVKESASSTPQLITASANTTLSDRVDEGGQTQKALYMDNVTSITFTLVWQDEPDRDMRHTNTPDTLKLTVVSPGGENKSSESTNTQGSSGVIKLTFSFVEGITGEWNITVEATDCGDQEPLIPDPFGFRTIPDTGNSWQLNVEYTYTMESTSS